MLPFELILAAVTMAFCGLAPALESSRVTVISALKGDAPHFTTRRFSRRATRMDPMMSLRCE
jgi:hypothetical protein